ncbi:hypothetical protein D1816_06080 [Aquimarina sp. AD10]|uniref:SGNH/GDSL hydrolase family protein n=1 Tax=Aquimarina aggregata TaxID=1642818 RepID=A0A162CTT5_9FLAO|nr:MULTISPECIES: hypothetical protein [Aquimarina]AXT59936.1 hypothetical protein D1816_06080 [Aquimarina sp. AD10]KZS42074.1 hypothetical protein AWE51_01125 [Aquimarina aggregata]RKM95655.1 hypothetical protein D7033_16590 [Aquimarina sp. AD10]
MKLLIIKLGVFFTISLAIVTYVLMNYGGNVDFFYEKFTTPKTNSMIIGDSRSFQGIHPEVIDKYFEGKGFDLPMLNYSFTIGQAIMGPLYNASIFAKLKDSSSKNGIFIISITPEMLTSHKDYDNEKGEFREEGQPPHNMKFVDVNPNYEYLIKNLTFFHFKGAFKKKTTVYKNGRLEESNLPENEEVFKLWKKNQIDLFLEDSKDLKLSNTRIKGLGDLITGLKERGNVFLIRMPISKEFLSNEDKYYPRFGHIVDSIADTKKIEYIDFNSIGKEYNTYDGHHIDKFAGKEFTKALCDLILNSVKLK